jgi:hypothetical protein
VKRIRSFIIKPSGLRLGPVVIYFEAAAGSVGFNLCNSFAFTMKLAPVIETHEHAGEFKEW